VSSVMAVKAAGMMDGKKEAPSMYEMEGASQSRLANGPMPRPADPRNTPPSFG